MMGTASAASALLTAACHCGRCTVAVDPSVAPIATSYCHCTTCRRLTGAPMLANVLLPSSAVSLTAADDGPSDTPAWVDQRTSEAVTRRRCALCWSPLLAALGPKRTVVPAALFSRPHPPGWAMGHHIHYGSRVIDVGDGLPKYVAHYGSAMCAADGTPL